MIRRPARGERTNCSEADDLLPFRLQDLCFLVVINDLAHYSVSLLASLPRWLRERLLNSIPVLDLCRLEHTAVTSGIEIDKLWNKRSLRYRHAKSNIAPGYPHSISYGGHRHRVGGDKPVNYESKLQHLFHLTVGRDGSERGGIAHHWSPNHTGTPQESCTNQIISVLQNLKEEPGTKLTSAREKFLSKIVSDILSGSSCSDVISSLTSIQGLHLLSDLIHNWSLSPQQRSDLLIKQATALEVKVYPQAPAPAVRQPVVVVRQQHDQVLLTPHRPLSLRHGEDSNPLRLLSLLADDCNAHPASASLHISMISEQILHALYAGRFAQDSGSRVSACSEMCMSSMKHFLSQVEVLRLKSDNYADVGVMVSMIEAAMFEGRLKYLFCILPDLYDDIIQSLSNVFTLQNIRELVLDLDDLYLLSLSKLLQGFMTAPCSSTQQLTISVKKRVPFPDTFDVADLATLKVGEFYVPQCAAEHKKLHFSFRQSRRLEVLRILLQLPTVRLKEICLDGDFKYVHLCSLHPDLQVTKLVIDIGKMDSQVASTPCISLLKKPMLQEISIGGHWGHYVEVKLSVMQGFRERGPLPPLRRILLKSDTDMSGLSEDEYRGVWDAIFSLSRLDQLEVVLGKGLIDENSVNTIKASWAESKVECRLKQISVTPALDFDVDIDVLSQFAQGYFIRFKDPIRRPFNTVAKLPQMD